MRRLTTLTGVHDQAHDPPEAGSSLGSIPSWINLCFLSCVPIPIRIENKGLAQSHKPQTPRQQNDLEKCYRQIISPVHIVLLKIG
jgi:hypothetical protein